MSGHYLKPQDTKPGTLRNSPPKESKRERYLLVVVLDRSVHENNKGTLQFGMGSFQRVLHNAGKRFQKGLFVPRTELLFPLLLKVPGMVQAHRGRV